MRQRLRRGLRRLIELQHEDPIASGALTMGRHTYGVPRVSRYEGVAAIARIGAFCSVGDDVHLVIGGNHRMDWVTTFPLRARLGLAGAYRDGNPWSKGDILIGNDVWIGQGTTIYDGVTIADGAVIAGSAVVVKDVHPYSIVAGVPAQLVGQRCSSELAAAMQRIAWWDWPDTLIRSRVDELNGLTIANFAALYDRMPAD